MIKKHLFSKQYVLAQLEGLGSSGRGMDAGFNLACFIASNALMRQTDKGGNGYMTHVMRVAMRAPQDPVLMTIAILHDVVEDSDWTIGDLRRAGFSERVLSAVDALTHRDGEKYFESIERAAANPDAVLVKMSDHRDNMDGSRMTTLPLSDTFERQQKYTISYNYLKAVTEGRVAPGSPIRDFIRTNPALDPGPALWAKWSDRSYAARASHQPRLRP